MNINELFSRKTKYYGSNYYFEEDGLYRDYKEKYVKLPNDKSSNEEIEAMLSSGKWTTYKI